ncbi:hypothetical protein AEQU3_02992 [Aequorivita antarctica]|nr:hypothetical protein AEQU3_02992 [Aequorivita antarctica]
MKLSLRPSRFWKNSIIIRSNANKNLYDNMKVILEKEKFNNKYYYRILLSQKRENIVIS